jgi:hypothetical protein
LERRRKKARSLSKWLGSLGRFGEPCDEYFISEAAKELGMGYADLEDHPERERLMTIAFTLAAGKADGEHAMKCNPEFIRQQKTKAEKEERAFKKK